MSYFTPFLYARPDFWEGVGRALDFGGTLTHFNTTESEAQADAIAMYSDWLVVGRDLITAAEALSSDVTHEVKGVIRAQAK